MRQSDHDHPPTGQVPTGRWPAVELGPVTGVGTAVTCHGNDEDVTGASQWLAWMRSGPGPRGRETAVPGESGQAVSGFGAPTMSLAPSAAGRVPGVIPQTWQGSWSLNTCCCAPVSAHEPGFTRSERLPSARPDRAARGRRRRGEHDAADESGKTVGGGGYGGGPVIRAGGLGRGLWWSQLWAAQGWVPCLMTASGSPRPRLSINAARGLREAHRAGRGARRG